MVYLFFPKLMDIGMKTIDKDDYQYSHSSGIQIPGRIVLNIWRVVRSEVHNPFIRFLNLSFRQN